MSDGKKILTARQAAQLVLAKAHQVLAKLEPLKKYETENDPKPGVKYGKIEKDQKPVERDYNEYEVKKPSFKDSSGPRLEEQVSPSKNPKEEAEGNNKPDGMEPEYQFKDKVSKELKKEKASHMAKSGMHTVVYQPLGKSETEENDLMKAEDALSSVAGDRIKRAAGYKDKGDKLGHKIAMEGAKESHQKRLKDIKEAPKPDLGKAENPDKQADAELGEKVEHDVEEHFKENADAEAKEGHDLMAKPEDKMEGQTEHAVIPRLIGSAKLSKFMEHMHSKRKNAQAQSAQAVGHDGPAAPPARSTQAGQPEMKSETGHEKGVHVKTQNSAKGSEAGNQVKTWPQVGKYPAIEAHAVKTAKDEHKKVLGEMKQMPKPKLPG